MLLARKGLLKTPERVAKSLEFLTRGYGEDPVQVINDAMFTEENKEMVVLRDVDFFSLCEHHLLPFFGKIHVAYLPKPKVIGLSKIPRLVDVFSRRCPASPQLSSNIWRPYRPSSSVVRFMK